MPEHGSFVKTLSRVFKQKGSYSGLFMKRTITFLMFSLKTILFHHGMHLPSSKWQTVTFPAD